MPKITLDTGNDLDKELVLLQLKAKDKGFKKKPTKEDLLVALAKKGLSAFDDNDIEQLRKLISDNE